MKKAELIFSAILVPLDFLMLIAAALTAYFLRVSPYVAEARPVLFSENLPLARYLFIAFIISPLWISFFAISGLYKLKTTRHLVEEFFKVSIASSAGLMAIIVYIFLSGNLFDSRFIILTAWVLGITFVIAGRFLIRRIQGYLARKKNFGVHKVFIIGQNEIAENIRRDVKAHSSGGYKIAKHFTEIDIPSLQEALGNPTIDDIILTDTNFPREKIIELIHFCDDHYLSLKFIPSLFEVLTHHTEVTSLGGYPLVEFKRTPLDGWGEIIKRTIDIASSFLGLILLFPFFALVAFMIKLDSEGSILVRLKRVGYGTTFYLYKFRSMTQNAESLKEKLMPYNERKEGPLFKMKNDPRVTKVGRILRKTRIDELPQLINVLRGEMSLVGPRPHEPQEVALYERYHKKVLAIKPGMTGLAQISGSSNLSFNEEVKLDTFYIDNWSLTQDVKILIKTLWVLFFDKSAC